MKKRLIALGIIASVVFLSYILILVKLQLVDQSIYKKQGDAIASRRQVLQALRGSVFDSNEDKALAYNVSRYQIIINPKILDSTTANIEKVANILDVSHNNIINALSYRNTNSDFVIRDALTYEDALPYIEKIQNIRGLTWKRVIQREYIKDSVMSHVLGYVGDISSYELQTLAYKGYQNFDSIGKVGIEKQYEDLLRGKKGIAKQTINVHGKNIKNKSTIEENIQPGYDIVLTLDLDIQILLEKAIGDRIGAGVIMNPSNGEIVAMASYPTYNSNVLVNSVNAKKLSEIQNNVNFPFLNRAIQSAAPPASTFKVLMATAFLGEDPYNKKGYWNHIVYCPGWIKIGNRIFRCWLPTGHGHENYIDALMDSCNVFFYSVGTELLGIDTIYQYAHNFGFGQTTGIDLPGEVSGFFPTRDWKQSTYGESWLIGDTANTSIGQGYTTVTPLQLATMLSGIVNDGKIMKPHVLKKVKDHASGKIVREIAPEVIRNVDIQPNVLHAIKSAMRQVAKKGTSSVVITTKVVDIAGKTGSGQIISDDFEHLHSWYIAYGPYDAPVEDQRVVVVWIDAVNDWEWWAPKATNIVFQGMFANQTYEDAVKTLKREGTWGI